MQLVAPKVYLLAETQVIRDGMDAMLEEIGAGAFKTDAPSGAEELIEVAGRLCYMSFLPKLNSNVGRVRTGNKTYLTNILSSRHGSVLEHATVTFGLIDVSPVFTHELVRHRAGTAFSQQSGRYVRLDEISLVWPDVYDQAAAMELITDETVAKIERDALCLMEHMEEFQVMVAKECNLDTTKDFALKKKITSAMRRLAPYGFATKIVFTANHRAIRHIVSIRNDVHAEEEPMGVFHQIGSMMVDRYPNIYQDAYIETVETELGPVDVWRFANDKV